MPGTAVVPRTEPKCKICSHPHRVDIEQMLIQRSNGEKDERGEKVTGEYIAEQARKRWGLTLSKENLTLHMRNHFRYAEAKRNAMRGLERRSTQLLQSRVLDEVFEQIDAHTLAKEVMARGLINIRKSDGADITVKDTLEAAKIVAMQKERSELDRLLEATAGVASQALGVAEAALGVEHEEVVDADFEEDFE